MLGSSVADGLEEIEDGLLEVIGGYVGEGVEDVGLVRSEWRGVRSESLPALSALGSGPGSRPGQALRRNDGGWCLFAGGLAEASVEEFAGGGYSVVGSECLELALHDIDQEAGDGASAVGVPADQPG